MGGRKRDGAPFGQPWIGEEFFLLRKKSGLTLHEVGKRVGITRAGVSLFECGHTGVSLGMFVGLCLAVGVEPADFLRAALTAVKDAKRRKDQRDRTPPGGTRG